MPAQTAQLKVDRSQISSLIEPKVKHGQFNPKVLARTKDLKFFEGMNKDVPEIPVNDANSFSQVQDVLKKKETKEFDKKVKMKSKGRNNDKGKSDKTTSVSSSQSKGDKPKAPTLRMESSNTAVMMWAFYAFLAGLVFLVIYYSIFIYDRDGIISPAVQPPANDVTKMESAPKQMMPDSEESEISANSENSIVSENITEVVPEISAEPAVNINTTFEITEVADGQKLYSSEELGIEFTAPSAWVQCEAFFALSERPSLALYGDAGCPITDEKEPKLIISFSKDSLAKQLENPLATFSDMYTWSGEVPEAPVGMESKFISEDEVDFGFRAYYGEFISGNVIISVPVRIDNLNDPDAIEPTFGMDSDVEEVISTLKLL